MCSMRICNKIHFENKVLAKYIFGKYKSSSPSLVSPAWRIAKPAEPSRDVRRTHCVRKAGRETTLHFISELCLSDFTVGDVEAATFLELSTAMRVFSYYVKRSFCVLQHEM